MKKFINEFKKFVMRGSVIDLAVGVIIGGAFGKIVSALVGDVVMPLLGLILGKINLTGLKIGSVAIGNFIQATIDFIIIAFIIFLFIKTINVFRKKEEKEQVKTSKEVELLTEIRDLLKK
ncbi:large conductance mechanosensitive channel protein MscL [Patescibacteria group bacterium]|nr:large conductance mechanosensitive channel protein MscL [Patescibacteria group bacterium]